MENKRGLGLRQQIDINDKFKYDFTIDDLNEILIAMSKPLELKKIETAEDLYHNEIDMLYAERLYGSLSHDDFTKLTKEADEKFKESKKNYKD